MLYEGETLLEAFSKAFGRPIGKQAETSPYATPEAIHRARKKAVVVARGLIASADVRVGARETGFAIVYDKTTGRSRTLREPEVGRGTDNHFHFNFVISRNREVILVTAHSHPEEAEAGSWRDRRDARRRNEQNEGIDGNDGDERLLERAPVVIKTPTGRVRDFWRPGGYD